MNYYNEFDPKAAAWLRELIKLKLIPDGIVDERSILDVKADELRDYTQCHFFAGIGGWSLALHIAGLDPAERLWTGSCPCQAFSTAGKQLGFNDPRDLWPVFFRLIKECRPAIVIGEQVEGAVRHGWMDRLQGDLEGEGYAVGAVVLGAHSVGSPHIRQRLYWGGRLGDAESCKPSQMGNAELHGHDAKLQPGGTEAERRMRLREGSGDDAGRMEDASRIGLGGRGSSVSTWSERPHEVEGPAAAGHGMANSGRDELRGREAIRGTVCGDDETAGGREETRPERLRTLDGAPNGGAVSSDGSGGLQFWSDVVAVPCKDGVYRLIPSLESGIFPLAHGLPRGVGHGGDPFLPEYANQTQEARNIRLKGYGNAIVPQVAAEFVRAFLDAGREDLEEIV